MSEEPITQPRPRMNRRPSLGVQVRTPSQRNLDGAVLTKQPSIENFAPVTSGTGLANQNNPTNPPMRRSSLTGSQSMMLRRSSSSAGFPPPTQIQRRSSLTNTMTGSEHSRWDKIMDGNEEPLSQGLHGNMDWNAEYVAQAAQNRSNIGSLPGNQASFSALSTIKRTMAAGMDGSSHSGMGMSSRSRNLLLVQAQADSPGGRRKSLEMMQTLENSREERIPNANDALMPPIPSPIPNPPNALHPPSGKQVANPLHKSNSMRSLQSGVSSKSLVIEDTGQMQIQMPQVAFFTKRQASSSTLQTEMQSTAETKQTQEDENNSSGDKLQKTMDRLNAELVNKEKDGQQSLPSSKMSQSVQSAASSLQRKMDRLNAEAMGGRSNKMSAARSMASRGSFRSRRSFRSKHDDEKSEASLLMGFISNRTEYLEHADYESSIAPTEHEEGEAEETDEESLFEDFNPELRGRSTENKEPIKMAEEEFDARRPWRKQLNILPTIAGHPGEMSEYSAVGTEFNQTKDEVERKETDSDITDMKSTSDVFELMEAKGALERMGYTGLLPDDHTEPDSVADAPLPRYSYTLSDVDKVGGNLTETKNNDAEGVVPSSLTTVEGNNLGKPQIDDNEKPLSSGDLAKTAASIGFELTMFSSPASGDHAGAITMETPDLDKEYSMQGKTEEIGSNGVSAADNLTEGDIKRRRKEGQPNGRPGHRKSRHERKDKPDSDRNPSEAGSSPGRHKTAGDETRTDNRRNDSDHQTDKDDGYAKKDVYKNKNRPKRSNSSERLDSPPPPLVEDGKSRTKTSPKTDDYDEEEAIDTFHSSFNYDSGSSALGGYDWSTHEKKYSDKSLGSVPSINSGGSHRTLNSSRSSRSRKGVSRTGPTLEKIGEDEEAPPVVPTEEKPKKNQRRRLSLRSSFHAAVSKKTEPEESQSESQSQKGFHSTWGKFSFSSFTSRSQRAGAVLESFGERKKKGIEGLVGPFIWGHRLKILVGILVFIFVLCLSIPLANRSSDSKSLDDQLPDEGESASIAPTLAPSTMPSFTSSPATLEYSKIQTISGTLSSDTAGSSVAFSSNGSFLAVGFKDANKVQVYKLLEGAEWAKFGSDIEGISDGDNFGAAISISDDGSRLAIGAPYKDEDDYRGYIRVLQYSSDTDSWDQLGDTMVGSEEVSYAGFSVSISGNGERMAIGEPKAGANTGLVRMFEFDLFSASWVQTGQTLTGVGETDYFGFSLSMSQNGDVVAIGVTRSKVNGLKNAGRVKIYQLDETISAGKTWEPLGSDIVGESAGDLSGYSMTITPSGSHIAIGSNGHDKITETGEVKNVGSCRVFRLENESWNQIGQTLEGEIPKEQSGGAVAITEDGKRLACGAPFNSNLGDESGVVRIYQEKDEEGWIQVGEPLLSRSGAFFGKSLAFTPDGKYLAVGAPKTSIGGNEDVGQVLVYESNV